MKESTCHTCGKETGGYDNTFYIVKIGKMERAYTTWYIDHSSWDHIFICEDCKLNLRE